MSYGRATAILDIYPDGTITVTHGTAGTVLMEGRVKSHSSWHHILNKIIEQTDGAVGEMLKGHPIPKEKPCVICNRPGAMTGVEHDGWCSWCVRNRMEGKGVDSYGNPFP